MANSTQSTDKKKVIWFTTEFDDSAVSNIFLNLYSHYTEIEFHVIALSENNATNSQALKTLKEMKVQYHCLRCSKLNLLKSIVLLHLHIQKIKPDIVHAQLGASFVSLMLCPKFPHNFKKIASFHNDASYFNVLTHLALKMFFSRFDAISAVSLHCLNTIQDHFDTSKKVNARCIYNPVQLRKLDTNSSHEYDELFQSQTLTISLISRLFPKKGHHLAFKAISRLKSDFRAQKIKLLIIGDGPLKAELESEIAQLGVEDMCAFLGYRHDVYELIARSTLVLYPSEEEGFGLVPCEALLLGKPVLVNKLDVYRELIDEEEFICDCSDLEAFSKSLFRMLTNYSYYQKKALSLQSEIQDKFNPNTIALQYETFYNECLDIE